MILVDTSVWVDHLRFGDEALAGLLETGRVLVHPFVIGELALGNLNAVMVRAHVLATTLVVRASAPDPATRR